jgi:hypothetical protein
MTKYFEYKYRCGCITCNDIMWVPDDTQSIICKCGDTNITNGIISNSMIINDSDMVNYLYNNGIPNTTIIKIVQI